MDDWESEGFISVLTQLHQTIQFPTQFWMDLTPREGEWFEKNYFTTAQVTALNPETDDELLGHIFGTTAAPASDADDELLAHIHGTATTAAPSGDTGDET